MITTGEACAAALPKRSSSRRVRTVIVEAMTSTDTPIDTTAIDNYVAAWNETDQAARDKLLAAAVGDDLWCRDPMLEADGREAFSSVLAAVQERFPGHVLTRTSEVDAHHDVVRFTWALGVPGEAPVFAGVDMAKLDTEGKLHRIVGFAGETVT
jgi:SnoaL-like domain